MEIFSKICLSLIDLFKRALNYAYKKNYEKQRDSISFDASGMLVDKFRGRSEKSSPVIANSKVEQDSDT